MRVLQVLPRVVHGGGAEQSLAMLAPLLMARGIRPHLAVLHESQALVPDLERIGVVVHDLSREGEDADALSAIPRRTAAVRGVIRAVDPDVVHSTLFAADVVARLASLRTGVPVLSTWATTTYSAAAPGAAIAPWKRRIVKEIDEWSGRVSACRFHAVTRGVADDGIAALHVPPDRVRVVERGRDPERFPPSTPERRAAGRALLGVGDDDVVVLNVARQFPAKGHVTLLEAFDRVAATDRRARLVLVGPDGPSTPEVHRALDRMAHRDRVDLLGGRDDVAALLPGADVFVLSSLVEGAAGAVIEAMAVGVPLVSTRLEGLVGVLEDGRDAVLAAPGDPDDLARALTEALADPRAAADRAAVARQEFLERFTLDAAADGMAGLYRDLAAGRF
jgi:glycosyltransferase involved in cell wall biosynthesis